MMKEKKQTDTTLTPASTPTTTRTEVVTLNHRTTTQTAHPNQIPTVMTTVMMRITGMTETMTKRN
jgi:hypothetical protein